MPIIDNSEDLLNILNMIPTAETAKVAVVRPTTRFEIVTADNPDMKRTLENQAQFIQSVLSQIEGPMTNEERDKKILECKREFQTSLSKRAAEEQKGLFSAMKKEGVHIRTILEDKGRLETAQFDYFTDQIFATDTGQYYDHKGRLSFIPASFKNKQRQGEERLATHQAENLGAIVRPLFSPTGQKLIFEGGDIRQMPGKKLFFIGQGHRSDAETSQSISNITNYFILPIKLLQEQFYHLDCCFLPLPHDAAVIYEGEYELNEMNEKILDKNGWPKLISGTETMTPESRSLIRTLYPVDKLILITKNEALAFATNAALLQSSSDNRFKLFVNGDRSKVSNDENSAIATHQLSYTKDHIEEMINATQETMDIIEVPYSTMHGSGGSVRCTVQEMACTKMAIMPHKTNADHFFNTIDRLENTVDQKHIMNRRNQFFGNTVPSTSKVEPAFDGPKI